LKATTSFLENGQAEKFSNKEMLPLIYCTDMSGTNVGGGYMQWKT
jgi:hypothetical protein